MNTIYIYNIISPIAAGCHYISIQYLMKISEQYLNRLPFNLLVTYTNSKKNEEKKNVHTTRTKDIFRKQRKFIQWLKYSLYCLGGFFFIYVVRFMKNDNKVFENKRRRKPDALRIQLTTLEKDKKLCLYWLIFNEIYQYSLI